MTNDEMLEFLESHEELVNQDNWDAIYALYYKEDTSLELLTIYLHVIGFDPLPYMTSIPDYMYFHCAWLEEITIHDSITSIGWCAFESCTLTSITIPSSVIGIDHGAFMYCIWLTDIKYKGTKSQWGEIKKGSYWNHGAPAKVVHCKDGDVEL